MPHRGALRKAPRRLVGALRQVSPRGPRRLRRGRHVPCSVRHAGGVLPEGGAVLEEAEPDALAYIDIPPSHWKHLRTNNVQERTSLEIKRGSRIVQTFPSTGSLVRLAVTVMCEQDDMWQESRYFSEAKMGELYDEGGTRGVDGTVGWTRLEAEARKMIESGLEHADRIEAALDINRVPSSRTPGRLASDRELH